MSLTVFTSVIFKVNFNQEVFILTNLLKLWMKAFKEYLLLLVHSKITFKMTSLGLRNFAKIF